MSGTARETAQRIWVEWSDHPTAQAIQLVDAITATLEERDREIERLKEEVKAWKAHQITGEEITASVQAQRDSIKELLREANRERNIMASLVERALCGCFSLDCVKHGAYSVDEIALYKDIQTDVAALQGGTS